MSFLKRFPKQSEIPNLVQIRPVGVELFYADGQAERKRHDEASIRISQFCEQCVH
jgi:hypothetical protein